MRQVGMLGLVLETGQRRPRGGAAEEDPGKGAERQGLQNQTEENKLKRGGQMKRGLCLFVFFLALISALPASSKQRPTYRGKCVGVHDGDTITVLVNGKQIKVRLEGIDAPELGQDFSRKSKEFLSGLVFGQEVTVKEDSIDRYGRTVGRVFVGYRDVSCAMISAGLAWHFKKYSSDTNLARLEESARMSNIAIWSMPNPIAPWNYRAGGSSKTISQLSSTSGRVIYTGPRGGKYYINSKGKKVYIKKKK